MDVMRTDPNGKNIVCRNCLERKIYHKQLSQSKANEAKIQVKEESAMKEYFCKACKYNFSRAKHLTINTCPYCGSGSVMTKGSTAKIIADASKMKGD